MSNESSKPEMDASTASDPGSIPVSKRESEDTRAPHPDTSEGEETQEKHEHLTGLKLFMIVFCLTLVAFLMLLDTSVVATAIPSITTEFHSLNDVGWYGTAYLLTNCALQPLTGKIYTQFSAKWVFVSFFAVFELGSVLCGAATSSKMLIVGRAIAGLGASGILNGGYTIIHSIVEPKKQPLYLGILVGIAQLGLVSGPIVGGALTQYTTWRWCFYINLPCGGAVAALLLLVSIPERKTKDKPSVLRRLGNLDLVGFALFCPTVIQFILALQWGGTQYPWNSSTVIGLFCGSFANLLVFLAWGYHKKDEAMIPFSIIGKRVIWSSCIFYACFVGSVLTAAYWLPIYFQAVRNTTPFISGVRMLPQVLSTIFSTIASGGTMSRVGYYLPFSVASGTFLAIAGGLFSTLTPTSSLGHWFGFEIIQGFGAGMGFQTPILAVQNNVPQKDVSIATALAVFGQNLGGAVFLTLAQVIFSNSLRHNLKTYAPAVDPEVVIIAGANGFRKVVSGELVNGVVEAYSKSYNDVMYLGAGAASGAFLFAFGMGWVSVKKEKVVVEEENGEKTGTGIED